VCQAGRFTDTKGLKFPSPPGGYMSSLARVLEVPISYFYEAFDDCHAKRIDACCSTSSACLVPFRRWQRDPGFAARPRVELRERGLQRKEPPSKATGPRSRFGGRPPSAKPGLGTRETSGSRPGATARGPPSADLSRCRGDENDPGDAHLEGGDSEQGAGEQNARNQLACRRYGFALPIGRLLTETLGVACRWTTTEG
jgi:hypothetical protein